MSTMVARTEPRMTFRSLCEFLKASDTRKLGIIREQKKPRFGPIKSYENALRQAVDFAVDGTPIEQHRDPGGREHDVHDDHDRVGEARGVRIDLVGQDMQARHGRARWHQM